MTDYKVAKDKLTLLFGGSPQQYETEASLSLSLREPQNIEKGSLHIMWKSNPKSWVTQVIFQDLFFHHFISEVEKLLGGGHLIQHSFAACQCSRPTPIHGQLSPHRQRS